MRPGGQVMPPSAPYGAQRLPHFLQTVDSARGRGLAAKALRAGVKSVYKREKNVYNTARSIGNYAAIFATGGNMKGNYYVTTAIAYTSGKPHIGNTYEAILTDAIVRFKRMQGYNVRFQTGTDEHGQKIEEKAKAAHVTPKEYVDGVAGTIRAVWDGVGTSYDKFIRTTDEDHVKTVQKIFRKFYEQGDIYKGEYEGWYCTPCESFWTESQLVDGKCPDCGREVRRAKEEAYFFRMGKYADRLIAHIESHPDFIRPVSRKNEMMNNFLKKGLQDLCVSRSTFKWGIPVDFDEKHVVYVWLDALTNYISGLGYDPDGNSAPLYDEFWRKAEKLHVIGKDIARFHTIYWPIFLMALGEPLPEHIFAHPWLLQGGEKMSKSRGNVIYADDLASVFGADAVRYFVLHEMPYEGDGTITWELMCERVNSDLANTLGNLVRRTLAMTRKYFGGVVKDAGAQEAVDEDLKAVVTGARAKVERCMEEYRIADALNELFAIFRRANKYIDETMPWVLGKDETKQDRLATVLYNLTESILTGASLLYPFLPRTAEKIASYLNAPLKSLEECDLFGAYSSGGAIAPADEPLFARFDWKEVAPKVEAIQRAQREEYERENAPDATPAAPAASPAPAEATEGAEAERLPEITIDDFAKIELRVGEVIACERVKKSEKLLHETVKVGDEVRSVVSGIAKYYTPEEMVGKRVVLVTNLKPVRLCGVRSEGMILCAEDAAGNLSLISPEKLVESGAKIR